MKCCLAVYFGETCLLFNVHTKWNPGHFQTTFLHACYFLQRHSAVTDVLFGLLITKKMEANGIFCFYMQCPWVKFWYCNEEKAK